MSRNTWMGIAMLATDVFLVPAVGIQPRTPAMAQETDDGRAELIERVLADGLTREQLVGLYSSLTLVEFEPPACVEGAERFDEDVSRVSWKLA